MYTLNLILKFLVQYDLDFPQYLLYNKSKVNYIYDKNDN